jgi:N utilization substance protein A
LISGTVQRIEGGVVMVNMGKSDGILPKSEQIPGESFDIGKPVRAVITEVKKAGQRVKIVLSRRHPDFVRRLFEREIPEISEGVISIRGLSREAGFRSKVAVSSLDNKIDAVGACVGVRGTRIKNIVDELGGERIDIVRWNESLQVLIPNALQPAEIEEVMLCHLLGRAVVLVRDDQLSLAIGRKGQNVRLATKLVGWDIEIRTAEELDGDIEKAVAAFTKIPGVEVELAERLVEQGILGYDDLSVMEVDSLVSTIEGLTEEMAEHLIQTAETFSEGGAQVASNEPAAEGEAEEELSEQSADELAEQPALESTESSGTVSSDD